ncbi:hypothetical protein R3X28_01805 [Maribacter sp. TH_r10]|uniref:hypothetical protein n=1 Tax=Maribacter sp. TH_r10 TaxID=3082086 RepID=UPI00295460C7|nr:hypothetical protein [Maribacter sp. TH_r10]MDV7137588.1 hypothetical protein [Maribacter sp. TH_r10]
MKKEHFFEEIKGILLLAGQDLDENTDIEIDSMSSLLLIEFFDENFSKTISETKLKQLKRISDLIEIAGEENLK